MKMQDALDLAVEMLISAHYSADFDMNFDSSLKYKQAADMLRNGGPVVEKSDNCQLMLCDRCKELNHVDNKKCPSCGNILIGIYRDNNSKYVTCWKRWTEHEKIQIVTEKSESTFEEIK